jgi:hypothetical protein
MNTTYKFWQRVIKTESCWNWVGPYAGTYGMFIIKSKTATETRVTVKPHRFSYELHKGKIPDGLVIDHICKNQFCVNPDHLEAVSQKQNVNNSYYRKSIIRQTRRIDFEQNIKDIFLERIEMIPFHTCWEWTGSKDIEGYGRFGFNYKTFKAHRFSYQFFNGTIPDQYVINHICKNTSCVNPKHLQAITSRHNVLIGNGACAVNSRRIKCKNGHDFDSFINGHRACKQCVNYYRKSWRQNRKNHGIGTPVGLPTDITS